MFNLYFSKMYKKLKKINLVFVFFFLVLGIYLHKNGKYLTYFENSTSPGKRVYIF